MLKGKDIKKVFPYFNKIITATQKEKSIIEVKIALNQLIFTLIESASLSIIYSIPLEEECKQFDGLFFEYKELSNIFSKVKANDDIKITRDEQVLVVLINEEQKYIASIESFLENTSSTNVEFICETTEYNLLKCIEENKIFVSKNDLDYNNNLYFKLSNNILNIYNTNDIAVCLNSIIVEKAKGEYLFAISNEEVLSIYKWINAIKNLKIQIALSDSYIFLKTKNEVLKIIKSDIYNIDTIIKSFESINNIDLKMIKEYKLSNLKNNIYKESNKLSKENNQLKLSSNFDVGNDITVSKKLFIETIKTVSEDSIIGLLENELTPIMIINKEDDLNNKILFNLIK